jgi:hypothetical protein
VQRFGVGGLASILLAAATVVLVGVPVIAGFWSTDANPRVIEAPIIRVPAINCLDLRNPANLNAVRHLAQPELSRYATWCHLDYTKSCSAAGTIVNGKEIYSQPPTCEIKDKHGKVVRTYTTDSLGP